MPKTFLAIIILMLTATGYSYSHISSSGKPFGPFKKEFKMMSEYDLFAQKWDAPQATDFAVVFNVNEHSDIALIDNRGRVKTFRGISEHAYGYTDQGEEYQFRLMVDTQEIEWFLIYFQHGSIFLVSELGTGLYLHGHDTHSRAM